MNRKDIEIINSVVESDVEVEITEEMIMGGVLAIWEWEDEQQITSERRIAGEVYKAMERVRRFQETQKWVGSSDEE